MKKIFYFSLSLVLTVLATLTGTASNVMVAAALPDAGTTESGNGAPQLDQTSDTKPTDRLSTETEGIATETQGRATTEGQDNREFYLNDIDKKIVKIRPMSTPIDQISRYANSSKADSFICKYYSVGTRPIKTKVSATDPNYIEFTTGNSFVLKVEDPSIFTMDDTIRVVGKKAAFDYNGVAYSGGANTPDIVLCVCGRDSSGYPLCYVANGDNSSHNGHGILLPSGMKIYDGQVVIRMGKACGEMDVQTGRFNNTPEPDVQYCQNFMIQVEQSTFDKIAAKEVNWGFTDLEEDSLYDMRLTQELTALFGDQAKNTHIAKDGALQWFTKGIWWMAGKDLEVGHYDQETLQSVVTFNDVVDLAQGAFVGAGTGNKKKVIVAGSDMVNAFSKIDTENIRRTSGTVTYWNLEFTSIKTGFGEFLLLHHELFDLCGMADQGFMLDPEYLSKRVHIGWERNVLDLKKAGIRNTDAVVMQEVACLYLRYPNAHARLKLAATPALTLSATTKAIAAGATAYINITSHAGNVAYNAAGSDTVNGLTVTVSENNNQIALAVAAGTSAQSTAKDVKFYDEAGNTVTVKVTTTA